MDGNLREAIAVWQGIKLSELQRELDKQGQEIVDNQRDSQNSRKALADQTRDYKKLEEGERLQATKNLLKSYQAEIDNLTKRSKFAETSFLNLYKLLSDAPDPAKILETTAAQNEKLQQVDVLLTENKRLREELDSSNKEFVDLTTKASTATRLKEKLAEVENKMESIVQDKVKERELQIKEEFNAKVRQFKDRELELERQINRLKDQTESLQTNHKSTQSTIFAHSIKFDEAVSAKLAELEIVMVDLERANERIAILERERELQRTKQDELAPEAIEREIGKMAKKYDEDTSQKELEISRLTQELAVLKSKSNTKQVTHNSQIAELEGKIVEMQEELDKLREKLSEQKDYAEIKKELEILKVIEFPSEFDSSNDGAAKSRDKNAPRFGETLTLEQLLIMKNKRLQNELTLTKVKAEDLAKQLANAIEREEASRGIIEEQRRLLTKLEEDIFHLNDSPGGQTFAEGTGKVEQQQQQQQQPTKSDALLTILTSQRDRFRNRNKELEEQVQLLQAQIHDLSHGIESLKTDNVKLYENIRYLQSYNQDQSTKITIGPDVASRYSGAYEEKVNPFTAFHEKEKTQRYNSLSVPEKLTISLGKALISNKYGRMFTFFYALILHFFVLFIVYRMSMTVECIRDNAVKAAGPP